MMATQESVCTIKELCRSSVFLTSLNDAETRSKMRQIVIEADTTLSSLDDEIDPLQTHLEELRNERQKMQNRRDVHDSLLAPIRRLPPKLLSYMFTLCVPTTITTSIKAPPLLLLQIDRLWRTVALSTPRLWCSFRVTFHGPGDPTPTASLMKLFLERSGACLLRVYIITLFNKASNNPIIEAIIPYTRRIKSLSLNLLAEDESFSDLAPMKGCLSSLRELRLHGQGLGPTDAFSTAPELKTLVLGRCIIRTSDLPVANLTLCKLIQQPIHQIHELLRQAPNLEVLLVEDCLNSESTTGLPSTTIVSHLTSLTISASGNLVCKLCGSVTLPSLRSITVYAQNRHDPLPSALMSLLDRSSCQPNLESFITRGVSLNESTWLKFLASTPSLTKLEISAVRTDIGNQFLSLLTNTLGSGSRPLIPQLQSLELEGNFAFNQNKLMDMIESRWRPNANGNNRNLESSEAPSLRRVVVRFGKPLEDTLARLQKLRREGLDISWNKV